MEATNIFLWPWSNLIEVFITHPRYITRSVGQLAGLKTLALSRLEAPAGVPVFGPGYW